MKTLKWILVAAIMCVGVFGFLQRPQRDNGLSAEERLDQLTRRNSTGVPAPPALGQITDEQGRACRGTRRHPHRPQVGGSPAVSRGELIATPLLRSRPPTSGR